MKFDSYIVSETKTAFSVPIAKELLPKKDLKQKAFTLAETLITLSIIGVVAAMTVPTLMSNINKHGYVTGLKKAYSNIQNAVKMMPISVGCSAGDYSCVTIVDSYQHLFNTTIFANQFKVVNNFHACREKYPTTDYYNGGNTCFQTIDGTVYILETYKPSPENDDIYTSSIGVDINGYKGPNKYGRDTFMFSITKDGKVIPHGSKDSYSLWQESCTTEEVAKHDNVTATSCTARVLEENAMNY